MQDYCGEYKNEEILNMGLQWLNSIKESEASRVYARNPHELWRSVECLTRLTVGEVMMYACLSRKASSKLLDFKRLDYPEMDPRNGTSWSPSDWRMGKSTRESFETIIISNHLLNYFRGELQ